MRLSRMTRFWIVGPVSNLTLTNLRILDLKADGINFDANGLMSNGTITTTISRIRRTMASLCGRRIPKRPALLSTTTQFFLQGWPTI
jgi:hypothetical protein